MPATMRYSNIEHVCDGFGFVFAWSLLKKTIVITYVIRERLADNKNRGNAKVNYAGKQL
jgi:hypothetical protein